MQILVFYNTTITLCGGEMRQVNKQLNYRSVTSGNTCRGLKKNPPHRTTQQAANLDVLNGHLINWEYYGTLPFSISQALSHLLANDFNIQFSPDRSSCLYNPFQRHNLFSLLRFHFLPSQNLMKSIS